MSDYCRWQQSGKLAKKPADRIGGFEMERKQVTFNADGEFILISMGGEIIKKKKVPDVGDRKARLLLFDIDKDGIEEIFVYGTKNHVIGVGRNFEVLPGFPVKGNKKPSFTDLNFDKIYEMIVGSYDGNVYAYTLSK